MKVFNNFFKRVWYCYFLKSHGFSIDDVMSLKPTDKVFCQFCKGSLKEFILKIKIK